MKAWKRYMTLFLAGLLIVLAFTAESCDDQRIREEAAVERQQKQYAAAQPVPAFDWSLERHMVSQLYQIRNNRVATHSVWRSDRGLIEGDCVSMGFGIPYDTSLTNPLQKVYQGAVIEMAEPNGLFASKNTAATWVMCTGEGGLIEPVYVETKVTVYPFPVAVDYEKNRVRKAGVSSVTIRAEK